MLVLLLLQVRAHASSYSFVSSPSLFSRIFPARAPLPATFVHSLCLIFSIRVDFSFPLPLAAACAPLASLKLATALSERFKLARATASNLLKIISYRTNIGREANSVADVLARYAVTSNRSIDLLLDTPDFTGAAIQFGD